MLELRILGTMELAGAPSEAVAELLSQSRPTALLVYLGALQQNGFQRRDHLVTLFWPESDQEHARSNLRKLIFTVRRLIGDDVLEARGDEEIRLSQREAWCDAAELQQALRAGDTSRVVDLYRGPLLPGFHLGGAGRFGEWLDSTRRHLSRETIKAVLHLADAHAVRDERSAAGDLIQFIRHLEPDVEDEHHVRKLILLLDRLGDRSTALGLYEGFRKRLWASYGALPSPETRSLIERFKE